MAEFGTLRTISSPGFVIGRSDILSTGGQFLWGQVAAARDNADSKGEVPAGTVLGRTAAGQFVPRADTKTLTTVVDDGANTVTVTLVAHGYLVGDKLTISGSTDTQVNGTFLVVTVADADTFTYTLTSGSVNETASGTIIAAYAAWGILLTNAREDAPEHARTGYGVIKHGHLFENILPDATGTPAVLPAAYASELALEGCVFSFEQYSDSRLA